MTQVGDHFQFIPLYAFTSKKKVRRFVKERTGEEYPITGKHGQCSLYMGADAFCVILMRNTKHTPSERFALLAHECVHYAQYHESEVGCKLDDETEAYLVQAAMRACIDQIGEEWFLR